jgi:tetratricopeptide (TPR) repeat protein
MAKIGRNDPCPCGSGKKYKRCCLPLHETAEREGARLLAEPAFAVETVDEDDELDRLSNSVPALITAGRVDEAEAVAQDLLRRYPDQVDGLERLAQVLEARGNREKAADYYRQAAAFTSAADGFDPEVTEMFRAKAEELDPKRTRP